jgi:hypothetical protein
MYIELKSGSGDNGPAWICNVALSKSKRMVYFNGKVLKRKQDVGASHLDVETGEEYWVSEVKKKGSNRHWAGKGKIMIEENVIKEYLDLIKKDKLDKSIFEIIKPLNKTDKQNFKTIFNAPE